MFSIAEAQAEMGQMREQAEAMAASTAAAEGRAALATGALNATRAEATKATANAERHQEVSRGCPRGGSARYGL